MSSILWKNFYTCFSKLKCFSTVLPPPSPSQHHDHNRPSPTQPTTAATLINSLYDHTTSASASTSADGFFFSSSSSSDSDSDSPPDFATIFASQRFFFPSPGRSNSIIDPLEDSPPESDAPLAIPTYSPDPYQDFRRSMQEMVESRRLMDMKADWDYLHKLLVCYLSLNPKHTHDFIFRAFADLVVSFLSSTVTDDSHRNPDIRRGSSGSRRLL